MKPLLTIASNLMMFLSLATLIAVVVVFAAHKLRQRAKPATTSTVWPHDTAAPSLVHAYDPNSPARSHDRDNAS